MTNGHQAATWDLEVLFPGGSGSAEFKSFLAALERDIGDFGGRIAAQAGSSPAGDEFRSLTDGLEDIGARLKEAESFALCLASQNQKDKQAVVLIASVRTLAAAFESHLTRFDRLLADVPDEVWPAWMQSADFSDVAFPLTERRMLALEKLAPEAEALISDLSVDGYHGWSELYDTIVGAVEIPVEEEDRSVTRLSVGQAYNRLHHPSKVVRDGMFALWERTWENQADVCAAALNRLAGFRLQVYKHRGWRSVLKEPLALNRMSAETLECMWDSIRRHRSCLLEYFRKKAALLGVGRLGWTDVEAGVGGASGTISYQDGAALIVEQFRRFGPQLAAFAETALRLRWIEAEDRPDKRPGGFCTSFPVKKQTRIFMTYEGTLNNVSTLAHELGHGFHQHVMDGLPLLAQQYAMNVAETASTFAELIVSDAAVRFAPDRSARLALLDDKIQRSAAFLMNIHARFLFETAFYREREAGPVAADRLNALMVDAQREAYHDALASYHPHFWASKLHFYITDVPFYNFPYTFGYLFSTGLFAMAEGEGAGFEQRYIALLRDTGRMTVEQLARRHLGADIARPEFWDASLQAVQRDVNQFVSL